MRIIGFIMFLLIAISIYSGIEYYIYKRLVGALSLSGVYLNIVRGVFVFFVVGFFLSRFLVYAVSSPMLWGLVLITSLWLGISFYLLIGTAVSDLLIFIGNHAGWWKGLGVETSQRLAVAAMIAVAAFGFSTAIGGVYSAWSKPKLTDVKIPVRGLPDSLSGYRIAQLSDMHLGVLIGEKTLSGWVEQVNAAKPDLVVITGDLVDENASVLADLAPVLGRLKAREGVWASMGNHEMYTGDMDAQRFMETAGVKVLRNETARLESGLVLAGVDDPALAQMKQEPAPTPKSVLNGAREEDHIILLHHRPINSAGYIPPEVDVILAGHTHAGQLWPFTLLTRLVHRQVQGGQWLGQAFQYVSRGTGTWGPPMRVGASAEIAIVTLEAGGGGPLASGEGD